MTSPLKNNVEANPSESLTKAIGEPIHLFKRPNRKAKEEVELNAVRFILPNGQNVEVPAGTYIVMGRQDGNERTVNFDLSVLYGPESGVSRTHAIVQITYTAVFVRDYNSRNGTFLNGEELYPMRDYAINDGDELRLGHVAIRVIFI